MAGKRKAKNKQNNQVYYDFPDYTEVTPEIRKVLDSIPNPFKFSYFLGILCLIVGSGFLILQPYVYGLIKIYYMIFGYAGIGFGIVQIFLTFRKNQAFNKFIKRDKFRIIWIYKEKEYDKFYSYLSANESGIDNMRLMLSVAGIALMTVFLYFTMNEQSRFTAIPFGAVCIGIIIMVSYVIPRTYILDAARRPYLSLVDDNAAFVLGRFYRWDKGYVRFKPFEIQELKGMTEMNLVIQEKSIFGKKTPVVQILLPDSSDYTLQFARREAKRINKERKYLNDHPEKKKDFLDKTFEKMTGREN